jgi:hypothetical protein
MLHEKRLILIGSTGQNAGKTTVAKALIMRLKDNFPVVALKITSVAHSGAVCPRGGHGCGACVNIEGEYVLEEELGGTGKDTALFLEAGAERVFWLRSLYSALEEGYTRFLEQIPKDAVIICESNSLRTVVEPGYFIMVDNGKTAKPSAEAVIAQADMILPSYLPMEELQRLLDRVPVGSTPSIPRAPHMSAIKRSTPSATPEHSGKSSNSFQ